VPGVRRISRHDDAYRMTLEDGVQPEALLQTLVDMPEVTVERFERVQRSLDDIFVQVVGHEVDEGEEA
jgi:ABC-type uncharacterized transport system ATPase subunit